MYLDDRQKLMFYMHSTGSGLGVIGCISDKRYKIQYNVSVVYQTKDRAGTLQGVGSRAE